MRDPTAAIDTGGKHILVRTPDETVTEIDRPVHGTETEGNEREWRSDGGRRLTHGMHTDGCVVSSFLPPSLPSLTQKDNGHKAKKSHHKIQSRRVPREPKVVLTHSARAPSTDASYSGHGENKNKRHQQSMLSTQQRGIDKMEREEKSQKTKQNKKQGARQKNNKKGVL